MPKDKSQASGSKNKDVGVRVIRARKGPIPESEKSTWRPSFVDPNATILKTDAKQDYHLNDKDLVGVECTVKLFGRHNTTKIYIYNERGVELKAWEKYGGPADFETMLNQKKVKFYEKYGCDAIRIFRMPISYELKSGSFPSTPSPEISTPTLIRFRDVMTKRGEKWLWDRINTHIDRYPCTYTVPGMHGRDREKLVQSAIEGLTFNPYPRRPITAHPNSPSFLELKATLSKAPRMDEYREHMDPGIEHYFDGSTQMESYDWCSDYLDNIYAALIKVINNHGLDGWECARWLVYDKYAACNVGYLSREGRDWTDHARYWVQPNYCIPDSKASSFHDSVLRPLEVNRV